MNRTYKYLITLNICILSTAFLEVSNFLGDMICKTGHVRAAGPYKDTRTCPNQVSRPNKVLRTGPNQVLRPKKDLKTGLN